MLLMIFIANTTVLISLETKLRILTSSCTLQRNFSTQNVSSKKITKQVVIINLSLQRVECNISLPSFTVQFVCLSQILTGRSSVPRCCAIRVFRTLSSVDSKFSYSDSYSRLEIRNRLARHMRNTSLVKRKMIY